MSNLITKEDTAIDVAIKDTKLHLENKQMELQLLSREIKTLQGTLNMLESVKESFKFKTLQGTLNMLESVKESFK